MTSMEDERWVYWRMKAKMLEDENEQLKRENYLLVSFIRRNHDVTMVSRILKE